MVFVLFAVRVLRGSAFFIVQSYYCRDEMKDGVRRFESESLGTSLRYALFFSFVPLSAIALFLLQICSRRRCSALCSDPPVSVIASELSRLRHMDKQNEILMEAYRSMLHESQKLQVEEEMLMHKLYEVMSAHGLIKKAASAVASATMTPLTVEAPPNKLLVLVAKWRKMMFSKGLCQYLIADDFSDELADGLTYVAGHDEESRPVLIRVILSNASDNVYWTLLAQSIVHGAMADYTGHTSGLVNRINENRNHVVVTDRMWARLLSSTNQPSFLGNKCYNEDNIEEEEPLNQLLHGEFSDDTLVKKEISSI
ncbi:hypothetical protein Ahy_B09g099381 [Arachis hypogaea]|uniref:Uncharacterized protein n=1 Tax=Arachis hypogaea TaxID=3818 RepID=A0A444XUI2_ARAHY|nr:hypothetical protein Ahy_B09g099381 [Arachis hypogaea]